jgi:hypothetical protein
MTVANFVSGHSGRAKRREAIEHFLSVTYTDPEQRV